jgi:NCAIR mutase (PurE)-related protein
VKTDPLRDLLESYKEGALSLEEATGRVRELFFKDLGYATVDNQRQERVGYPEVIYCAGKTLEQVKEIVGYMHGRGSDILATRATPEMYRKVKQLIGEAEYHETARCITFRRKKADPTDTYIAVVTAGTSDLPVAEEASVTAEFFGNRVERINDVGVAGIHRLFDRLETVRGARVVIVAAGMEGALASVIGGLVDKPVIAVPTSVGYGAAFGGLAALLAMLNSCASGVAVVNIDNGFGAGYLAGMINKLQ